MKRIRYIAIYGVLIIGLMGCKKEVADPDSSNPNVLPPLTHEGKNTFGCKVNGEVWVAHTKYTIGGPVAMEGNFNLSNGSFLLEGNFDENNRFETVRIGCENLNSVGEAEILIMHDNVSGFIDYKSNYDCSNYYYREEGLLKRLHIHYFNTSKRIISGTFEMDLVNPSCPGDTVKIREGRFDWRY